MPLIAMTREMGSLGKDVAAAVADRLDKQVVHHEIIDNLASKMRLRKSHVIRFLEGRSGIWERLTTDKTSLSIYTADETFALAESGKVAVIRGWGATHLLRPVPHVISVRICAPFGLRVERMLERHPGISQACVVPIEDEIKGQKPVAFVIAKAGHPLTEDEVKQFALTHAPAYQHPRFVWFIERLPLSSTNKVDRAALKREAESRLTSRA